MHEGATQEATSQLAFEDLFGEPWNVRYLGTASQLGITALAVLVFVVLLIGGLALLVCDIFFLYDLTGLYRAWTLPGIVVRALGIGFVLLQLAILAVLTKVFVRLNRMQSLKRLPAKWGPLPIYHLYGSFWRYFSGGGTLCFGEDYMRLRGRASPNLIQHLRLIVGVYAIFLPLSLTGIPSSTLAAVLFVIGLLYEICTMFFAMEELTLSLRRQQLTRVTCAGPVMTLKLKDSGAPHLNRATFLIDPAIRGQFFAVFEHVFPGMLPEQYQQHARKLPLAESQEALDAFVRRTTLKKHHREEWGL